MKNEQKTYRYSIGGKQYIQKPLVMGQVEELIELVGTISLSDADLDPATLVRTLGPDLYLAVAIVLREEGKAAWWERNIPDLAEEIRWEVEPEQIINIVQDFFDCNPLSSLFEKLSGAMADIQKKLTEVKGPLTKFASASPEGTSPGAT